MKPVPMLIYSDAPDLPTGLGRITKDIATLASRLPQYRVGTFGKYGRCSSKLPFTQYVFQNQWGEDLIEEVWNDFSRGEPGIIFTIWDASRLTWFANPMFGGPLQEFLQSGRFQRWGYFPVDAYGPGMMLTTEARAAIAKYDRVLAYSMFGQPLLEAAHGGRVDWIPHGFNAKVFQSRGRAAGRMKLGVNETDKLVGMVGTNQSRKDWGVAMEAIAILKRQIPNVKFWCHIDEPVRYWNIYSLIADFGLQANVRLTQTGSMGSEELSYLYSACDLTILPSHEGFGFSLVESMACGVPALHGTYGGGSELIPDPAWLVPHVALRLDTQWNIYRPVFYAEDWSNAMERVLAESATDAMKETCINAVSHLDYDRLWPSTWEKFFTEGLQ